MKHKHGIVFGMVGVACLLIGDSPVSIILAGGLLGGALALQEIDRHIRRRQR